jgi:hypothetical protein
MTSPLAGALSAAVQPMLTTAGPRPRRVLNASFLTRAQRVPSLRPKTRRRGRDPLRWHTSDESHLRCVCVRGSQNASVRARRHPATPASRSEREVGGALQRWALPLTLTLATGGEAVAQSSG